LAEEAAAVLGAMERRADGQSAVFSLLGHKGDVLLLHFRRTFDELADVEMAVSCLGLAEFLEPTASYVSVVELGLYEASSRIYGELAARAVPPGTPAWEEAVRARLAEQARALTPRLWPKIPARRYFCFYPMERKRGETKNWYQVDMAERRRMMREHGAVGRRYAGQVTQIISSSIGFDDWEWGVDLFADDPLAFKRLIYEMRFDEVSAVYARFGPFYIGLRFVGCDLGTLLEGRTPELRRD
jgi:chlorite dismutase